MGRLVLLLIDQYGVFKPLASHLRIHGFTILSTESPEDILKIVRLHEIEAIVLEDSLRGVPATETLKQVRDFGFTEPVILLTRKGPDERFTTVIEVPYNLPELLEALA